MTTEEAMRRIENAGDYSQQEVEEAVAETLRGEHGEVAQVLLLCIAETLERIPPHDLPNR